MSVTEIQSVFAEHETQGFTKYAVELTFQNDIHGGIPSDPKMVRGWLARNAKVTTDDDQHRRMFIETVTGLGIDLADLGDLDALTYQELVEKAAEVMSETKVVAFKRGQNGGPILEERNVKAMLKESANIVFAGQWFNKQTGAPMPGRNTQISKGLKSLIAEWVSIDPLELSLGDVQPEIVTKISHTSNGSGLSLYEAISRPVLAFTVSVFHDLIPQDVWAQVWTHAQRNGLGANRSLGNGRFLVTRWEKV